MCILECNAVCVFLVSYVNYGFKKSNLQTIIYFSQKKKKKKLKLAKLN